MSFFEELKHRNVFRVAAPWERWSQKIGQQYK